MPCGIRCCINHGSKTNAPGCRLHRIPTKEPARSQWLALIHRQDVHPYSNFRICSLHFSPSDYEYPPNVVKSVGADFVRNYLKRGATPSQNLSGGPRQNEHELMNVRVETGTAAGKESTSAMEQITSGARCTGSTAPVEPASAGTVEPAFRNTAQTDTAAIKIESVISLAQPLEQDIILQGHTVSLPGICEQKETYTSRCLPAPCYASAAQGCGHSKKTVAVQTDQLECIGKSTQANFQVRPMRSIGVQVGNPSKSCRKEPSYGSFFCVDSGKLLSLLVQTLP